MKTYCKRVDPSDPVQIEPFIWGCLQPKLKRKDYSDFTAHYCRLTAKDIRKKAREGAGLEGELETAVHNIAAEISGRIKRRALDLAPIKYQQRRDGLSKKIRNIGLMSVMQQVMEHVAVGCMQELWDAKYEHHQYASIKGRGQLQGAKTIMKWTKSGKTKYFVKLDVRKCFASVTKEICMRWLQRDIGKNGLLLWFVDALLTMHGSGLVIGSLLSQFLCNYFMSYAYRFVMSLHKQRRGKAVRLAECALFYMDDIMLAGSDRRNLVSAVRKMARFMQQAFGLTIKDTWHIRRHEDAGIDMMGYVVTADGKLKIRKRVFIRARRAFVRMARGDTRILMARRVAAYYGFFKAAKIRDLRTHEKRVVNVHTTKFEAAYIVSLETRRELLCAA